MPKKTSNYTLPTKPELEDAYQALWATLQNKLGPYFSDYGQLIEKGSPLNNQYQQLKSNISQHIPSNEDFRSPQRMSEWAQAAALNAPMGLTLKSAPPTTFSKAHKLAQKNAALPIEQGGLGLPPNNTAMDRAKAMGFDTPAYHGTSKQRYVESTDIPFFDETKIGDKWGQDERGFSFTNKPDEASYYAASDRDYYNPGEGEGAIYPVLLNKGNTLTKNIKNNDTVNYWDSNHEKIQKEALKKLSDSVLIRDASRGVDMNVIFNPKNIRSRFAAFDPMKKDSANILASILAGTTLAGLYQKNDGETSIDSIRRKLNK